MPLHKNIIELGFIAYRDSIGNGRLFPEWQSLNWFSDFTNDYLRKMAEVPDSKKAIAKKVMYSLRHHFADAMREAGIDYGVLLVLMGHRDLNSIRHYGTGERPMNLLAKAMREMRFPHFPLAEIRAAREPVKM